MRSRTQARRLGAIRGLISNAVGERLYDLARAVPAEQAIIEIGAYMGKSTCYLGEGSRDGNRAPVHTVDLWDTEGNVGGRHGYDDPAVFESWMANVAQQQLHSLVASHKMAGVEYAKRYRGRPVGLLFIDGDHEYESVRADYEAWTSHLAPGATVVFDDYSGRNAGVRQFADEIADAGTWDIATPPLAILRMPDGS